MRRIDSPWDEVTARALPSSRVSHLHLLRHGHVDTGGQRLAYGHLDLPLSAEGQRSSDALLAFVRDGLPPVDRVYSSDLSRCLPLAQAVGQACGAPVEASPLLREQHMGEWEGLSWAELTARDEDRIQAWWADYLHSRAPGGESLADLAARVDRWWDQVAPQVSGRRAVVVTHIGVIRVLLCRALGLPLDQALRWAPPRGSHTWLVHGQAGFVVQAMGEQPPGPAAPPAPPALLASPAPPALLASPALAAPARSRRLALSGSAGTGKTTLGLALARRLDLPYIPEGMRARLEAGLDLHALDFDGFRGLLWELWSEQVAREDQALAAHGGYVADRSPWDFAAFWLHYRFASDRQETERFFHQVRARAQGCDRVVLLPWGVLPLQADGVRSTNPWLQRHFQACVEGLLAGELPPERLLRLPPALLSLEDRVAWVAAAVDG